MSQRDVSVPKPRRRRGRPRSQHRLSRFLLFSVLTRPLFLPPAVFLPPDPECNTRGNEVLSCFPEDDTQLVQDEWSKFIWWVHSLIAGQ